MSSRVAVPRGEVVDVDVERPVATDRAQDQRALRVGLGLVCRDAPLVDQVCTKV
jgi:hypothetical protein